MLETEILIVGGGASGLTASLLLSSYGIDTLLVSKYPHTSTVPKAHLLSIKTMEMMRELGLEPEIRAMSTPPENMLYAGWFAGVAGPTADHGREIARMAAWGFGHQDADWRAASGVGYANLMQAKFEPLLRRHAEARAPGRVRFNHNFLSVRQREAGGRGETGVVATIEDRASGEQLEVAARYLLACDGGRAVGPELGVEMQGHLGVATSVSIHFSADLSAIAGHPDVLIRTIFNPDVGTPCVLVPVGPDNWGPRSEEWVMHFMAFPGDYKQFTDEDAIQAMRAGLGLPDFSPVVHMVNRWPLDAVVASQLRVGDCFMLGDAAHRMPPSGGHGLNTAVQDGYNLCWKLAAVLRGRAPDALLDSYEAERRPVAEATVASAFGNWTRARSFAVALGFLPSRTAAERWDSLRLLWDGTGPQADALRRQVRNAHSEHTSTYNHLNINFGHSYDAGALVAEPCPAPVSSDPVQIYRPGTRPGCSAPHALLEDLQGRTALGDLLGHGRFVLLTGEDGGMWREAAARVAAERDIALETLVIGPRDGDRLDMRLQWERVRGVGPTGAVLVRPDRFIAWRAMAAAEVPYAALDDAFSRILAGRPGAAAAVPQVADLVA